MITDKETWDFENAYLDRVVKEIKLQLGLGKNAAVNYRDEALKIQKEMWEDVKCTSTSLNDLEDAAQIWQYQSAIASQARNFKVSHDKVAKLERMYPTPYFGRIDFIEEGESHASKIYIGIYNLSLEDTLEILVYDWRAPISGMFYDHETGPCSYNCPAGTIKGQMLLKRQYKIENGRIEYLFDSSLSINDEMLREILGKSTDTRMKTIVTSIQREQNTVIRNSEDRIVIVEGPAGSGKTSIALHRAAYLLYKYRNKIKSENILIFSPNHVFEDYISSVLPELGEENIQRSTFADFFSNTVKTGLIIETMNQQMEYVLSGYGDKTRLDSIRYKASGGFSAGLQNYVRYLENGMGIDFEDISYCGMPLISAEEIRQLIKNDFNRLPYVKRLEKLNQRVLYLLEQAEEKRSEELWKNEHLEEEEKLAADQSAKADYRNIKNNVLAMTSFDILKVYRKFCQGLAAFARATDGEEAEKLAGFAAHTLAELDSGLINYEDTAPLLYLKAALDSAGDTRAVKHVIIDEAQDYTPLQYEIFKKAFDHCNMTILGDINQSVNGYMNIGGFEAIGAIFSQNGAKSLSLTKSYRSSKEIADFCRELLKSSGNTEQLNRHGSKPQMVKIEEQNLCGRLAQDIKALKDKKHKLIAIICKTARQCEALYKTLSPVAEVGLVSNRNEAYQGDVMIIPSYLAKGLEFDAVLVCSVEDADYPGEEDRRLLYTVCTRALHELYLYYFDKMSHLVSGMDESLYTRQG